MKKKYKRALAAALAAVMIWNTCDWHPQVLAGSSVQYIEEVKELSDEILHQEVPYGTKYKDLELPDKLKVRVLAEEASDEEDGAEDKDGAEKIATPSDLQSGDGEVETEKKSQMLSSSETDGIVRKASPSEADATEKSEIGGVDDTEQKASPSDAEGTKTDKSWKEVKVRWVLDETFSEKDTYDGETPGTYVFDAELKSSRYELDTGFLPSIEVTVLPEEKGPAIIGFSELDEAVAVQKLPLGAKERDILLPDTLEVEVEEADETLAEDSQNVHLVEVADKGTEKNTDAETAVWQISGITWKLDEEQSDLPEFNGGISEKDYFEEFDEDGEPIETSDKTWNGYYEANQDYNGCAYVYTPVLPEEYSLGEEAELPEICVLVGEMQLMTLAGEEYNLNNNYLNINSDNRNDLNGKTITGSYCPSTRPRDFLDIKGGITIDNVTVDLTIKDVTIKSGGAGASGWDLAGIYLKGHARLNLTLEGDNTLLGLEHGAGIEVEKGATLVITENSTGSLKAVGGAYGAAGIGGNADAVSYFHGSLETKDFDGTEYGTGTIIIKGGTIAAEGGVYWVSGVTDYQGGAGIGTGSYGIGGTIEILGGTITAEGGKLTGAGIGGGKRVLARMAGLGCLFVLAAVPVWLLYGLSEGSIFTGNIAGNQLSALWRQLICVCFVCAGAAALAVFLFEASGSLMGGMMLLFLTAAAQHFLAGGFLPLVFLPETVRRLAPFLPSGILMDIMKTAVTGVWNVSAIIRLILMLAVCLAGSCMLEVREK